ncbi:sodium-dependent bicarbonate transport family permease [uncultured Maricaulis sp.]|uniref:sodium-dependent bicarbonate transport family permease n=1 Tax=uncultured Maricaulis sp. TaxID=174710 RepID=UPI002609CD53|nr:sodium-dependent bicarbonate transport family permease [uncultured Maricaulis sp.]
MDWLSLAGTTLFSPAVLFFVLGLLAAIVRSDLAIPEAVAKGLSLYLVMAIGFKGGAEMAVTDPSSLILLLCAGVILSAGLPLIGFGLLRATTGVDRVDAAAIAAHYGSISIVTFIAAKDAGAALDQPGGGYMVAVAAAMEAPAILTGLMLAGRALASPGKAEGGVSLTLVREAFTNGSILLLLGAFAIGWISGPAGMATVEPFFVDIFRGVLCLFLLDMGLIAGRGLVQHRDLLRWPLIGFGLYMPAIGAAIALGVSRLIGLAPGDGALLMTLAASASYIAVPAAMRLALPQAKAALSLTLSLGVTFPFNLLVGIPVYAWLAGRLLEA